MSRTPGLPWITSCLLIFACGDKPGATSGPNTTAQETEGNEETGNNPTSGGPGASEATSETPDDTSAGSAEMSNSGTTSDPDPSGTSGNFLVPKDGGGTGECDPKAQDCPEGQKCTAVSPAPGEPWGINQCVELMGDDAVGDPCDIVDGKYTGLDNCGVGLICLLTDDEGKGGACVEFCNTDDQCPITDANCVIYNDGALPICLSSCDPLIQDCPEGQACYSSAGEQFVCFKESAMPGEGMPGSECQYVNQCQKGSFCANAMVVENCPPESNGCCTPYCSLSEGDAVCQPMEDCLAFFEGMAPPGYENVGVCRIPE